MAKSRNHFFYVLECEDGSYYAGYAVNVERRFKEHISGTGAKYTKQRKPIDVIHQEVFFSRSEACKKEAAFKQLTRKEKENYIETYKESWAD